MQRSVFKPMILLKMKWQTILLASLGFVLLAFFSTIALAPAAKYREIREVVEADSVFAENFEPLYEHPDMHMLLKERAYKEALLQLTQSDSIQLVIDLSDSTVCLNIKGVSIHQSRIPAFRKDKFLERIPFDHEIYLLSRPLPVVSQFATIVKEPVVLRHAPKDTLEAQLEAWQPDTLVQYPAFVSFVTEYNFQIIFEQDKNELFRDYWRKFSFYSHLSASAALGAVKDFVTFTRQDYRPAITIKIPVDDLRAIYRALPDNALVVLRL